MRRVQGTALWASSHKRSEFSFRRVPKIPNKLISTFVGKEGIMEFYFGNPGIGAKNQVFNGWLCGRGDGDRVSIATQSGGHPKNVNFLDGNRTPPRVSTAGSDI